MFRIDRDILKVQAAWQKYKKLEPSYTVSSTAYARVTTIMHIGGYQGVKSGEGSVIVWNKSIGGQRNKRVSNTDILGTSKISTFPIGKASVTTAKLLLLYALFLSNNKGKQ